MANGTQTYGIDVSHWNDTIDWDTAVNDPNNPKINFCYAKVSQLHRFDDPATPPQCPDGQFPANWAALQRVHIPRGAYFYCEPYFSAQDMAAEFFKHYTPAHGDLPPSLDIEDEYLDSMNNNEKTAAENVQQILDFAGLVSNQIWGAKPLIYIRADICDALGNPPQFLSYPLWIANYDDPAPTIPKPWAKFTFWQYSNSGTRAGISSGNNVDLDWFNGPAGGLNSLLI
jgi:lysozyme